MTTTINASTSSGLVNTADTSGVLQLQTNSTTAVTIDTSQNFFVNKTTYSDTAGNGFGVFPNSGVPQVSCVGASNSTNKNFTVYSSTDSAYKFYVNYAGGGYFAGNVGIGTSSPSSSQKVTISSNGSGAVQPGIYFDDTNSATAKYSIYNNASTLFIRDEVAGNTRVCINSNGDTLFGGITTSNAAPGLSINNSATYGAFVYSNSPYNGTRNAYYWAYNGSVVGYIQTGTSTTSYVTSSDYRLKENVQPMTGALAKVAKLKPCTYKWKLDGKDGQGFIAHELQEIVPEAVAGEKDAVDENGKPAYQGVDTSFLVATLTAAIQEQQALITDLTTRLAALEGAK